MKVAGYKKIYWEAATTEKGIEDVIVALHARMQELAAYRKIRTPQAILAIFKEVNNQWEILAPMIGQDKDFFKTIMLDTYPELHNAVLREEPHVPRRY